MVEHNVSEPERLAGLMAAHLSAVATHRDQSAFAELFRHYAPRIKSYLRRLGAEDAVAEELAQEAMLTVWRKAEHFDPDRAGAGTWIFAIARNLRIDRLRRERRPEIDEDDPALVADPAPPADEALETGRRDQRLRAALSRLPPDQARVVALSFFEDVPHSEIATRLDVPLGTVKSRLRLAMGRIRALLGESR
jgi:RNA polymerase sigma-70 factor (ECF subfamily)